MKAVLLTPYRSAVLEAVRESRNHPTAAEVFRRVRRRRPRVAHATIYNALGWLTRHGYLNVLEFGDGASRYDPMTERHDHLVCTRCGALVDFQADLPKNVLTEAGRRAGFRVENYRLELRGLCPRCANGRPATRNRSR